ncbi:MAG TPA: TCP-1/cpn60 chaperonin family protein [Syntrophomonas sp.]|nr:TCP-1/cpn60 chaperonin family protein [Syntrophomonas sp.]HRW12467.1 TCP-1/cpn60 chaperonin family protein [Syntrophomonas sp.]
MKDNHLVNGEVDQKFQTLLSNANAARVISQAIEGTIGPKGLDIMLVDKFGDVVISNDGATILKLMEVNHPAARMIINAAQAQQDEVGDGTTTATLLAGAMISVGTEQVLKGVPVTKVIQGITLGTERCLEVIESQNVRMLTLEDEKLLDVALIAGRGDMEVARLVIEGAKIVGEDKMFAPEFKFCDTVVAREAVESQVFTGVLINREPLNQEMPTSLKKAKILLLNDALAPEAIDSEARGTENGFQYYLHSQEQYQQNLHKIAALGINLVLTDRSIDDIAEQIFSDAGIIAIHRVSRVEMEKIARSSGARKIKRSALAKEAEQLEKYLGFAEKVEVDQKAGHTLIYQGSGESMATILIGAATAELVEERERIARDAAAAVQAALLKGVVPGGGSIEIWAAQHLNELAWELKGMSSYGVLCVKEALLKPFHCIAQNAGFNPLEKMEEVVAVQMKTGSASAGIDCDSGEMIDTMASGIVDPTWVKMHAIKTAADVTVAILKINTIIKMTEVETGKLLEME